jgi:hypothetical protein
MSNLNGLLGFNHDPNVGSISLGHTFVLTAFNFFDLFNIFLPYQLWCYEIFIIICIR